MTHKLLRKIDVPSGSGWTLIELQGDTHQVQNTTGVVLEYALAAGESEGAQLLPYEFTPPIHANMYVRFYDPASQNGEVEVLTIEPEVPVAFPNILIVDGTNPEQAEVTLVGSNVYVMAVFRNPVGSEKAGHLISYRFTVPAPDGNVLGEVIFQIVGVDSLTGTPTYAPVVSGYSIMEVDHTPGVGAPGVDVTAGLAFLTVPVDYVGASKGGDTGQVLIMDGSLGLSAYAGDVFAVLAKNIGSAASVKARFSLNWREEI